MPRKPARSSSQTGRLLEPERQGRGGVVLERPREAVDLDRRRPVRGIELQPPRDVAPHEAASRVLDAEEGGHGQPRPRADTSRGRHSRRRLLWGQAGHERRAEARMPVPVAESSHRQGRAGDEALQPVAEPVEAGRIDVDAQPAERERPDTRRELDLAAVGSPETLGQPQVVEVVGEPKARVRRVQRRPGLRARKEDRVGIHGRSQIVGALARPRRVEERQLGQGEQSLVARPLDEALV